MIFDGVAQEDVSIRGAKGKSPMFFRDFAMMGGVFLADYKKARVALAPLGLKPLHLPFGKTLVAVHCMEYKDSDIGPYNEISLAIAVKRGWLPFVNLLQAARSQATGVFHASIQALPVTTRTALDGGVDFFNYPKYLADIRFRETASHRVCTLRDKDGGDVVLEFVGRRIGTWSCPPSAQVLSTLYTYPKLNGETVRARMVVDRRESAGKWLRGADLRLGTHTRAREFAALGLGALVQYDFSPRCQGILYKPEPL